MSAAIRAGSVGWTVAAMVLAASPEMARADAPAPDTYFMHVTSNTVRVCVNSGSNRHCPGAGDLVRENAATGAVVKLPEFCMEGCYLDECVPPGSYRYGYVVPLACDSPSGTDYFGDAEVTSPLGTCERSIGNSEPTAYSGALPWRDDPIECEGTYGKGCGCSASGTGSSAQLGVFVIQGIALLVGMFLWKRRTASR
jgi:hypothetical protein